MNNGRKKVLPGRTFWIFVLSLATSTAVFAQAGVGGLSGLVADSAGDVISGASVKVQSSATGIAFSAVTTGAGFYSFASIPPGTYQVTVSQSGFDTLVRSNVLVTVDQVTKVNVTLQVGAVSQVVNVTGTSSLDETSNSTVGQLINQAVINRVPLLTRNVYELVQLSAGVNTANGTPNAAETQSVFGARPGANVASYTINGANQGAVQFLLDGSPINIGENGIATEIPALQVPLDDVEEYRIETQNTPAIYQSGGAGAISLVTKSGTNQFHGDGFLYLRPNAFAANDYFAKASQLASGQPNQPQNFHRYQEGGSIGGPILHNKLFIFADYEATQQDLLQTGTFTVPTAAERQGNFSADGFTIYNPLAPDLPNGRRQAFSGNIIPPGDLNPIALKVTPNFPSANQAGVGPYHLNNYFGSGLNPFKGQQFDIRVDQYLSAKQHLFGRFSFDRLLLGTSDLYGSSDIWDPNYYQNITNGRNLLLADDYSLSENTILQLRGSFTRHYENQTGDPRDTGFDITSLGFPGSLAAQQNYHAIPYFGFVNHTTALGTGDGNVFQFVSQDYDLIAAVSSTRGKHALSAGFEFEKQFMNVGQPLSPSGSYMFDNTATSSTTFAGDGNDYASFLLGMGQPPGYESNNFTKDLFGAGANPYYAAYLQDNYQVSHNFTVNMGLRWDIFGGRTERHDRLESFYPALQYSVAAIPLTGGEQFVGNGKSRSPFSTNMKDFGPRLSFAWQANNRLVVRGGSGIYYGPSTHMVAGFANDSDGFYTATTWNATAYNADGNTVLLNSLSNPFPNGVTQPVGNSLGPATNLGSVLTTQLHSQREPTTYNYNLGVEYDLPHQIIVAAAFVGSRGHFLPMSVDLNQLSLSTIGQYGSALNNPVPNKWESLFPATSAFYGQATVPQYLALESYPQFNCGGINCGVTVSGYPGGDSEYDSLQVKLEKRLTSHITTLASFTRGKLMSDVNSTTPLYYVTYHSQETQDWRDLYLEHALSPQDLSYQFTWQTSYDLPVGNGRLINVNGWANQALGGWTLNTIAYLSSGNPVNTPNGTGDPFFNQRVDMTCDPGKGATHTVAEWFSYNCFSQPASNFVAGTSPALLDHVRTNGAHDLDVSIFKNFSFGGSRVLRFEFSAYNVTNSVQMGYPSVFWNPSPTPANMAGFGQITSDVNTPRQFQFASRFMF